MKVRKKFGKFYEATKIGIERILLKIIILYFYENMIGVLRNIKFKMKFLSDLRRKKVFDSGLFQT